MRTLTRAMLGRTNFETYVLPERNRWRERGTLAAVIRVCHSPPTLEDELVTELEEHVFGGRRQKKASLGTAASH